MATKFRFLVDTNVLIDYCDAARPLHAEAVALMRVGTRPDVELVVLVSSLKDVYYVQCRMTKDEPHVRDTIRGLTRRAVTVIDLLAVYGEMALVSDEPDFEDALVRAAAEALQVTAIVSRDERAFANSFVPRLTAGEVVAKLAARS